MLILARQILTTNVDPRAVRVNPLSATIIVIFNPFYQPFKSHLLGTKCVLKHQDLQIFGLQLSKYE